MLHVTGGAVHDPAGKRGGAGVRVAVTIGAIREAWTGADLSSGEVMALLARHRSMAPAQRILSPFVIELPAVDRGPLGGRVAVVAGRAQPAPVRVVVAGDASALEPHPAPLGSPPLGQLRRPGHAERPLVTVEAFRLLMAPIERPASAGVVEPLQVTPGPADQRELTPGVIRVAAGAALVAHPGVEPPTARHQPGDFLVTLEAADGHLFLTPPAMALHALQRPLQILVRLGEGTRRDLSGERTTEASECQRNEAMSHHSQVAPRATTTATWMSTASSAAIATGRCSTCQYRNTSCVASSMRACCASAISRRASRSIARSICRSFLRRRKPRASHRPRSLRAARRRARSSATIRHSVPHSPRRAAGACPAASVVSIRSGASPLARAISSSSSLRRAPISSMVSSTPSLLRGMRA